MSNELAKVSEEELCKIKELEDKMNIVLIAYEKSEEREE